jgi:hypothetical protein
MLNPVVVFQQIALAGQASRVDFESGPTKHQFYLSEGQLVYATSSDPYYSLDAFLLRKQSLTKLDQKLIRSRAQEEIKPVEAIIETQGLLPRDELASVMASLIREIAYDLFSWTEGDYSVSAGDAPPSGALLVDFALEGVLEKGRQVHDKWRRLSGKVPKLEAVLHRASQATPTDVEITPEEWQILAAVDDVRNVYEICYELSPNRLQILSRMARLLEKGLLEPVDFKDRTRPGGLGSKGLKFSTVSTVFRNLLSVLIERFAGAGEADPIQTLNRAAQAAASKGHHPVPGLAFDAAEVFSPLAILNAFGFVGQSGDLKSILRGIAVVLQQALSELKEKAPEEFELAVTDLRGVLGIAEELVPDFHLSLHTAVEKALLGDPVGAAPVAARPEVRPETPVQAPRSVPSSEKETAELEMPPLPDSERTALTPLPGAGEAVTEEVDQEALAPILQASGPASRTPPSKPEVSPEPEPVTVAMQAPAAPPPAAARPAATAPPRQQAPPQRPVAPPAERRPAEPRPTERRPVERPPAEKLQAERPEETVRATKRRPSLEEAAAAQSTTPAREKAVRPGRPRIEAPAPEEEEEEGGGRRVLVAVLILLVFLLLGVVGVGGYVLTTDKTARIRLQRALRKLNLVEAQAPRPAPGTVEALGFTRAGHQSPAPYTGAPPCGSV